MKKNEKILPSKTMTLGSGLSFQQQILIDKYKNEEEKGLYMYTLHANFFLILLFVKKNIIF